VIGAIAVGAGSVVLLLLALVRLDHLKA